MKLELVVQNGYKELKKNKINTALLDSEILLANVLKKSREFIILNLDKNIHKKDFDNFQNMVSKRHQGQPVAYLTNKKFFWKYEFFINKHGRSPLLLYLNF